MSRLVAYFGNDPDRLECALFPARTALYARVPENATGWGFGFVQGGDVLLQKRPRNESTEVDFFGIAKELKTADALVGRIGLDDGGRGAAENADPFRFRSWLFGAVGEVPAFDSVRDQLLESVPEFLRRNIRGRSPSEHLFHVFLAFLHDAGRLEMLSPPIETVQQALRESVTFLDRLLAGKGRTKLTVVATNGRCLVAESHGHALQYLQIAGITDCAACRDREPGDRRVSHESLRAVVIEANHTTPTRPGWTAVPDGAALFVGPDRMAHVVSPTSGR